MIQLKVPIQSAMDENLEEGYNSDVLQAGINSWTQYVKSLPLVKTAQWVAATRTTGTAYTLITFESEEHKTWFILRWS
jgi:hypothetical protein